MTVETAEILCVGTELLIGDIVNTNAAFLSRHLAEMGIAQYHQSVVGDNPVRLKEAVQGALSRCDLLILTGGLGPTYDDLTKEVSAEAVGLECELHPAALCEVEAFYTQRGIEMHQSDRKQAFVPKGGFYFKNEKGSAPGIGFFVPDTEKLVVLLPGPPREMQPMFVNEVRPYLEGFTKEVIVSRNIHFVGIGESSVDYALSAYMHKAQNPTVAPYCSEGEVRLRVSARHPSRETALAMCDRAIEEIRNTEVGRFIYGVDTSLPMATVARLRALSLHITAAESCTGGLLSSMLTDVAGASSVFDGAVVTYANRIKRDLACVSQETLDTYGAVSAETAAEMCRGIRKTVGADVGVSITGYAGPDGGDAEHPVGTVFVGVSYNDKTAVRELHLNGDRTHIRTVAAKRALALVLECLL